MKKIILGLLCWPIFLSAQIPDHIYRPNIRTVKLFKYGDIYSYPVLQLGNNEQLELHFDDMDNDVKNYYYIIRPYFLNGITGPQRAGIIC